MVPVTSQLSEDGDYVGKVSDACLALSPMVPHLVVQLFFGFPAQPILCTGMHDGEVSIDIPLF
jgi:hypothetical protein